MNALAQTQSNFARIICPLAGIRPSTPNASASLTDMNFLTPTKTHSSRNDFRRLVFFRTLWAVFALGLALSAAGQVALPYITDFASSLGFTTGSLNGQQGWIVLQGAANVTGVGAVIGDQCVALNPDSTTVAEVGIPFAAPSPLQPVIYVDCFLKPVATSFIYLDTSLAVLVQPSVSSSYGVIYTFDGSNWNPVAGFNINSDGSATDWMHLTFRLDFNAKTWDLYYWGQFVAHDVPFLDGTIAYLPFFIFQGDASAPSYLNYLQVNFFDPLFFTSTGAYDDVNNDGIPDTWETAHGFSLSTDDRSLDPTGKGKTVLQDYIDGTDPNDYYSGVLPVLTSLVSPSGMPGAQGLVSVKVTRASDGTPLVNAPVTLSLVSGANQISATPGGAGSTSVLVHADAAGIVRAYVVFGSYASDTLTATAQSDSQTATITTILNAPLPYVTDFESSEGYMLGSLDGQQGWSVPQGIALVTDQDFFSGSQSVVLQPGAPPAQITQAFAPMAGQNIVFVDFYAKPVAETDITAATTFDIGSARFAFVLSDGQGTLQAFNGDGSGGGSWASTNFTVPLGSCNQSQSWIELTARLDFTHETWDLYANGNMVAADLGFRDVSVTALTTLSVQGDATTASEIDSIFAGPQNPLFADVNNDGIDDAWEQNYGLSLSVNDRALDPTNNGQTVLQDYINGTDPTDYYGGVLPVLTSLVDPSGVPGTEGLVSVLVTDPSGNALAYAPLTFAVTTGASQISAAPGGTGAAQITVDTDASGIARAYVSFSSAPASDLLVATAQSGGQTTTASIYIDSAPVLTSLVDPSGVPGLQGLVSVSVTGPDGTPLANVPLTFAVTTGASQISATPGESTDTQVSVSTDSNGVAQAYVNFTSTAPDVLVVSLQNSAQPASLSINLNPPSITDFEASEGYILASLDQQQGWSVTQGSAVVTSQDASSGSQSVLLQPGTTPAQIVQAALPAFSVANVIYVDFYAKPSAELDLNASTTFDVGGARFAFLLDQNDSNTGLLQAFNGDGQGGGQWVQTYSGPRFDFGYGTESLNWIRLTARLDFLHQTWDLYANGQMVAADMGFRDNALTSFTSLIVTGDAGSPTALDHIFIAPANPLFADANNDGIDDAWEQQYGLSLLTNDRDGDLDGDGVSNLQEYINGTNPGHYDGPVPVVTPLNPGGQIGIDGSFSVQVTNPDGTPLANASVTFQVASGGSLIALNPGGAATFSTVTVQTGSDGKATIYLPGVLPSGTSGATVLNISIPVGATTLQQSVTLVPPPVAAVLSEVTDQRVNEYGSQGPSWNLQGVYSTYGYKYTFNVTSQFGGGTYIFNHQVTTDPQTGQVQGAGEDTVPQWLSVAWQSGSAVPISYTQLSSTSEESVSELYYYYASGRSTPPWPQYDTAQVVFDTSWAGLYPPDYLLTQMNNRTFSFTGNLTDDTKYALLDYEPPSTGPGAPSPPHYEVAKMRYKLQVPSGYTGLLTWFEVFTPKDDPSTPADESQNKQYLFMSWNFSNGMTLTPYSYTIDPLGLDPSDLNAAHRYPNQNGRYDVVPFQAELAVDANRDGQISFPSQDSSDATTAQTPFRFWLNDDDDTEEDSQTGDPIEADTVPSNGPDYALHEIVSERNLEDFSRLWINLSGLQDILTATNSNIQIGLKWQDTNGTTPAINIYPSADGAGSGGYLTKDSAAEAQITGVFNNAVTAKNGKQTVDTTGTFIFKPDYWAGLTADNPKKCLLFEGAGEGAGQLTIVILDQNGNELGQGGSVWLDLKNIKEMYDQYRATPKTLPRPFDSAIGPFDASQVSYEKYPGRPNFQPAADETNNVLVFVNGSNETYEYSTNVAETLFKRLWWQGYKGRFISFRWETLVGPGNGFLPAQYNLNEWMAWTWGKGLRDFVASGDMPNGYTVNVAAHSLGNLVVGSALQLGMSASNVVMMQGAIPAGCFDSSGGQSDPASINGYPPMWQAEAGNPYPNPTPDLANELGYRGFVTNAGKAKIYNFYNTQDYALFTGFEKAWEGNQETYKPDSLSWIGEQLPGSILHYTYAHVLDPSGNYTGRPLVGQLSESDTNGFGLIWSRLVSTPYESMSFVARSRSKALGAVGGVGGIISRNINIGPGSPTNLGRTRPDHSGEFTRNIQQLQDFYNTMSDIIK